MHQTPLPMSSKASPESFREIPASVPIAWVEDLFARLEAILGAAMGRVYATDTADPEALRRHAERVKLEWAEALAGLSGDEVRAGLAQVRLRKFPPNLPEFLHLCRPALDPEVAFHEAVEGMRARLEGQPFAWSHPAVYWAAHGFGYELRTRSWAELRKRWEQRMAWQWQRRTWEPIPEPPARIETKAVVDHAARVMAKASMQATREALVQRAASRMPDAGTHPQSTS